MTFYHATLDTSHYTFDAYDTTEATARASLIEALKRHARQVNINPASFVLEFEDGINVHLVEMGKGYRDHAPIGKRAA